MLCSTDIAYTKVYAVIDAVPLSEIMPGKLRQECKQKMEQYLLHDDICDDISPRWSYDAQLIAFERIGRGEMPFQEIGYFKIPPVGDCKIHIIATLRRDNRLDPFEEDIMDDMFIDDAEERFYAGYFSWIKKSGKLAYEFLYTQKTDIYHGRIDKNGKIRSELFCSFKRIVRDNKELSGRDKGDIPFLVGNHVYVMQQDFKVRPYTELKLHDIPGEFVVNRYANASGTGDVVFISGLTGNGDVYMLNLKHGNNPQQLRYLTGSPQVETTPQWSPDGKSIVYASMEAGNMDIYILEDVYSRDVKKKQITNTAIDEVNPVWSPDGSMIAFYTISKGKQLIYDLYVIDKNNKTRKRIGENVLRCDKYGASWLPAEFGNKLIYISGYGDEMYIVDVVSMKRWEVNTGDKVMSDVVCAPYQRKHRKHLIIAYSAQYEKEGRKRIFIKVIRNFKGR
jgi:hypothetical protein